MASLLFHDGFSLKSEAGSASAPARGRLAVQDRISSLIKYYFTLQKSQMAPKGVILKIIYRLKHAVR
jgi:hypothetical protein